MPDYLIERYNEKIAGNLKAKESAIGQATHLWHRACEDIEAEWQAKSAEAWLELTIALEHRNGQLTRLYTEGPPPEAPKRIEHRSEERSAPPPDQHDDEAELTP